MTVRRKFIEVSNSADPLKPLKNQGALVTGANSGIGKARALARSALRNDVVINYVVSWFHDG